MNADEIKNALKCCLAEQCDQRCPLFGKTSNCELTLQKRSADLIESLQAQLAASQARERAAVEDLSSANLCRHCVYDAQCGSTGHYRQQRRILGNCDHWQWLGQQKGDKE